MNHSKVRARLNEFLERELSVRDHDRVAEHLARCAACRDELRDLEATVLLLRRLPDPEPPPAFAETVMARVRAGEAEPRGALVWLRRVSEPALALPLAVATLALAVAIGSLRGAGGDPESIARDESGALVVAAAEPAPVPRATQARPDRLAALRQLEHLNRLMREGRKAQVVSLLRGAGHPHSASLARHIETSTPILLASHTPGG